MTDQCSSLRSRERTSTDYPRSCQASEEQKATKEASTDQEAAREAEARRDEYITSGTDEGGRSLKASSDASKYSPMLNDDPKMKEWLRTKQIDPPIQSDPAGNAIVGALGGGLVAGARTAAAEALFPSTAGTSVLAHAATSAGKSLAKEPAMGALKKSFETVPDIVPTSTPATSASPAAPSLVGRSGGGGTKSEVVPEPTQSAAPFAGPWVIRG